MDGHVRVTVMFKATVRITHERACEIYCLRRAQRHEGTQMTSLFLILKMNSESFVDSNMCEIHQLHSSNKVKHVFSFYRIEIHKFHNRSTCDQQYYILFMLSPQSPDI